MDFVVGNILKRINSSNWPRVDIPRRDLTEPKRGHRRHPTVDPDLVGLTERSRQTTKPPLLTFGPESTLYPYRVKERDKDTSESLRGRGTSKRYTKEVVPSVWRMYQWTPRVFVLSSSIVRKNSGSGSCSYHSEDSERISFSVPIGSKLHPLLIYLRTYCPPYKVILNRNLKSVVIWIWSRRSIHVGCVTEYVICKVDKQSYESHVPRLWIKFTKFGYFL